MHHGLVLPLLPPSVMIPPQAVEEPVEVVRQHPVIQDIQKHIQHVVHLIKHVQNMTIVALVVLKQDIATYYNIPLHMLQEVEEPYLVLLLKIFVEAPVELQLQQILILDILL